MSGRAEQGAECGECTTDTAVGGVFASAGKLGQLFECEPARKAEHESLGVARVERGKGLRQAGEFIARVRRGVDACRDRVACDSTGVSSHVVDGRAAGDVCEPAVDIGGGMHNRNCLDDTEHDLLNNIEAG